MSITSFSANKLTDLISKISDDTIGIDTLRYDIVPVVRNSISQMDDDSKRVLAYVLLTKCLSICEYFDGEPMSVEASQLIAKNLKGLIMQALKLLASDNSNINGAIQLASNIIVMDITSS